jgi:hypothetical protein
MDLAKVLAELKKELENLDAAILSLERLQVTSRKRGDAARGEAAGQSEDGEPGEPGLPDTLLTTKSRGKGRPQ